MCLVRLNKVVTWLEKLFEESEIHEVVKGMNNDKASGPDSFTMAFFQACYDVIKEDITSVPWFPCQMQVWKKS